MSVGTNTSEINNNGSIDALTIAGAASALGIKDIIATPKQLNVAAPSNKVSMYAGIAFPDGIGTSNINEPVLVTTNTSRAEIRVLWHILPNMKDIIGKGVPLILFSTPPSRAIDNCIATPVYEDPTTANTVIIGMYTLAKETIPPSISISRSLKTILNINKNSRGNANVKNAATGFLLKALFSYNI